MLKKNSLGHIPRSGTDCTYVHITLNLTSTHRSGLNLDSDIQQTSCPWAPHITSLNPQTPSYRKRKAWPKPPPLGLLSGYPRMRLQAAPVKGSRNMVHAARCNQLNSLTVHLLLRLPGAWESMGIAPRLQRLELSVNLAMALDRATPSQRHPSHCVWAAALCVTST